MSRGSSLDRVFKAYDVRGLVPDDLSPALVQRDLDLTRRRRRTQRKAP